MHEEHVKNIIGNVTIHKSSTAWNSVADDGHTKSPRLLYYYYYYYLLLEGYHTVKNSDYQNLEPLGRKKPTTTAANNNNNYRSILVG